MISFRPFLEGLGKTEIAGAPEGVDTLILAQAATEFEKPILVVMRDETRMRAAADRLSFIAPDLRQILLPAWDCLPYDRVSPNAQSVAGRLEALSALAAGIDGAAIVLTTIASVLQKV
ncbi:MAG TPA: transcription-repair coupling factor, partial [Rhodospirillaceae bacterium]|nr:transcription-repair coupling factor [Rhodospirillaceae bacterium]